MGEEKFAQTALVKAVQGAIAVQPQQSGDLRVATQGGVVFERLKVIGLLIKGGVAKHLAQGVVVVDEFMQTVIVEVQVQADDTADQDDSNRVMPERPLVLLILGDAHGESFSLEEMQFLDPMLYLFGSEKNSKFAHFFQLFPAQIQRG